MKVPVNPNVVHNSNRTLGGMKFMLILSIEHFVLFLLTSLDQNTDSPKPSYHDLVKSFEFHEEI